MPENSLVGVRCSNTFERDVDGTFYYSGDNPEYPEVVIDPAFTAQIAIIDGELKGEDIPLSISAIAQCWTENNQSFLAFESWAGGGGGGNKVYFSWVNNGELDKITEIPDGEYGGAYFGCSKPIALTKSGTLYYQCGAGDVTGSAIIFSVNLDKGTYSLLHHCKSELNIDPTTQMPFEENASFITCS